MISKELLRVVMDVEIYKIIIRDNYIQYTLMEDYKDIVQDLYEINIYELAHKNLKEWAKLKSVFDIIDWSEEPEQIFKKAEELRNEIN